MNGLLNDNFADETVATVGVTPHYRAAERTNKFISPPPLPPIVMNEVKQHADTASGRATFRHIIPGDGDKVEVPDNVQFEHISMEVGPEGKAHLMWFQKDGNSIPPNDI